MHYYKFNIADYRKDTAHLSAIEHYIYRQLIDWYYLDEKPIPKETHPVIRRLSLGSESDEKSLQNVLTDFFKKTKDGWVHERIENEIAEYHLNSVKNKENGKKGGRPKKQRLSGNEKPEKTQSVNLDNPSESQKKPNHKPSTINHEQGTSKDIDPKQRKTLIPKDFKISDEVKAWAEKNNHQNLEQHFENFVLTCESKPYKYTNWDSAFKRAIRDNWAKIQTQDRDVRLWHETEAGVLAKATELRITQGTDEPVGILKQRVAAEMGIEL